MGGEGANGHGGGTGEEEAARSSWELPSAPSPPSPCAHHVEGCSGMPWACLLPVRSGGWGWEQCPLRGAPGSGGSWEDGVKAGPVQIKPLESDPPHSPPLVPLPISYLALTGPAEAGVGVGTLEGHSGWR